MPNLILAAVPLIATVLVGCGTLSAPGFEGPSRGNFNGEVFVNQQPAEGDDKGLGAFLKWQLTGESGEWPDWVDSEPGAAPPKQVDEGKLQVTFVNHATLLVQTNGLNILTDPHWSKRASPFDWVGPSRHRAPGIRFDDLPPIDVVLISHNHYDHLDIPTLKRLARTHDPVFMMGLGNAALLKQEGIERVIALGWWQKHVVDGVWFNFVPAQHFSGRGLSDRDKTLWGGWVIEAEQGPVYFAGDTGWGPHFAQIRQRFGPIRLAMIPIGAYKPRWFMSPVHIDPAEAVKAHRVLDAHRSVSIHWGTFGLADDGYLEPLDDLKAARRAQGVSVDAFRSLKEGQSLELVERANGSD